MKNLIVIGLIGMLVVTVFCGFAIAGMKEGPAPNSGDGVSDGSGLEEPFQNGEPLVDSPGPAPNSGDGVSDGSGF